MAAIIKRKSKYSVVYTYVDDNGEKKQKWETCTSHKEALKRKAEVEHQMNEGTFIPPNKQTISEFLEDFVSLYGEKKWGVSTYDSNVGLIRNYINPLIGDEFLQNITPKFVDQFYKALQSTKSVITRNRKPKNEYLAPPTIEKIHKLLVCAFKQALRWELLEEILLSLRCYPKQHIRKEIYGMPILLE